MVFPSGMAFEQRAFLLEGPRSTLPVYPKPRRDDSQGNAGPSQVSLSPHWGGWAQPKPWGPSLANADAPRTTSFYSRHAGPTEKDEQHGQETQADGREAGHV